jgi:hypothetical protein
VSDGDRFRWLPGVVTTWWSISREYCYYHNIQRDSHIKSDIYLCCLASIETYLIHFPKSRWHAWKWLYFTFKRSFNAIRQNRREWGNCDCGFQYSSLQMFYQRHTSWLEFVPMCHRELNQMDWDRIIPVLLHTSTHPSNHNHLSGNGIQCLTFW